MTAPEDITSRVVMGYREGVAFSLCVREVECGHFVDSGLLEQVRDALRAVRDAGIHVSIASAFRTMERQQELYRKWKEGVPGYNPAERPGYSKHQLGVAMDIHANSHAAQEEMTAVLVAWGFSRPHHGEAWHYEVGPISLTGDTT